MSRFIGGACGLTTPYVSTGYSSGEAGGASDDQMLATWQKDLKIDDAYRGKHVGVAFARKGDKVVVATATVQPDPR